MDGYQSSTVCLVLKIQQFSTYFYCLTEPMCDFCMIKALWWRIFLWHSNFKNNTAEVTLWIIYSDEGSLDWNSCWEGFLLTLLRIDILVGGYCQYFIVFGVICQHGYVTATSNDDHGISNFWSVECLLNVECQFNILFAFTTKKHQRSTLLSGDRWIPRTKGQ